VSDFPFAHFPRTEYQLGSGTVFVEPKYSLRSRFGTEGIVAKANRECLRAYYPEAHSRAVNSLGIGRAINGSQVPPEFRAATVSPLSRDSCGKIFEQTQPAAGEIADGTRYRRH
jgi:hypothetical protein